MNVTLLYIGPSVSAPSPTLSPTGPVPRAYCADGNAWRNTTRAVTETGKHQSYN